MSAYCTYEARVANLDGVVLGTFQFRTVATPTPEDVSELACEEFGQPVYVVEYGRTIIRNQMIGRKASKLQKVTASVRICA
jgi:hypothetical protein